MRTILANEKLRTWIDRRFGSANSLVITMFGLSVGIAVLLTAVVFVLWLCGLYPRPPVLLSEAEADTERLKLIGIALVFCAAYLGIVMTGLALAEQSLKQGGAENSNQPGDTP